MADESLIDAVREYYSGRLSQFGPTAKGVDWNSVESQELRFRELLRGDFLSSCTSLLDYGCGYGALLNYVRRDGWLGKYLGYDVAPDMIAGASSMHGADGEFTIDLPSESFDCTLASGLFNVRLEFADDLWQQHINAVLDEMWGCTGSVMVFNMLTSHSDADKRRANLYYAEPGRYLELCLHRYSRRVRLHHGYGLYEFTIQVEK